MHTIPYQVWFIIAAALIGAEMFTGAFYLAVLALAAVGSGVAAWCETSLTVQLGAAAVIAILGFLCIRKFKNARHTEFVSLDAGNPVEWLGAGADGHWQVRYRGAQWQARPQTPDTNPNAPLIISATRGNILIVKNLQQ